MNKINHLNQLMQHIDKNGIKGLLPQNIPDTLLDRMLIEVDAIEKGETEETPSSTLLMAILHLLKGEKLSIGSAIKLDIEEEKLMECFDLYMITLGLEEMRRKEIIEIPKESLPTIKNIFDKSRRCEFNRIK